jgi:hypothetical protein
VVEALVVDLMPPIISGTEGQVAATQKNSSMYRQFLPQQLPLEQEGRQRVQMIQPGVMAAIPYGLTEQIRLLETAVAVGL